MNKVELLSKFKEFGKPYYTFSDMQLILGLRKMSANKRIIDLVKQGFLLKLARNVFVPTFWKYDIYKIGNYIYQPSYLSFESALIYQNYIDINQEEITFVTLLKSKKRDIGSKKFIWSSIKDNLFFGFRNDNGMMIAEPEKALLDLLYLVSFGKGKIYKDDFDLDKFNLDKLQKYSLKFPNQTQEYLQDFISID